MNERFYHRPEMFYSPDKLVVSYGVPAPTPAFVYNAVGKKPLPTKDEIVSDTVDSIAARFNLRYNEQKWLDATTQLLADDPQALRRVHRWRHDPLHRQPVQPARRRRRPHRVSRRATKCSRLCGNRSSFANRCAAIA